MNRLAQQNINYSLPLFGGTLQVFGRALFITRRTGAFQLVDAFPTRRSLSVLLKDDNHRSGNGGVFLSSTERVCAAVSSNVEPGPNQQGPTATARRTRVSYPSGMSLPPQKWREKSRASQRIDLG